MKGGVMAKWCQLFCDKEIVDLNRITDDGNEFNLADYAVEKYVANFPPSNDEDLGFRCGCRIDVDEDDPCDQNHDKKFKGKCEKGTCSGDQ